MGRIIVVIMFGYIFKCCSVGDNLFLDFFQFGDGFLFFFGIDWWYVYYFIYFYFRVEVGKVIGWDLFEEVFYF